MKATRSKRSKRYVSRYVAEGEFFWQNQLSKFRKSGTTRRHYCRENSINYDRFSYWTRKLISQQGQIVSAQRLGLKKSTQLLPIQLKSEYKAPESVAPFSLSFKNGCVLHIHHEQALSIILEKMI